MLKPIKILDLSGYMFSGKAALHDLLAEIDGFATPGNRVEFDLIRVQDGLADLEDALLSWSPIRSDAAARRFLNLVQKMNGGATLFSRLTTPGFSYSVRYPGFVERSKAFIDSLTVDSWSMYWPYQLLEMRPWELFLYKLRRRWLKSNANVCYRLVSRENFYSAVKSYLQDLLVNTDVSKSAHSLVINNAFEGFDPGRFVSYFHDAKCIVIDRDPRDIFVFANQHSVGFNDQVELYRRIAGAHDVNLFINRLKTYRQHISDTDTDRVLRMNFEDLVLRYEESLLKIYDFLQISASDHVRKKHLFDPGKSKENIGLWKTYHDQVSIRAIEEAFLVRPL